MIWFIEFNLGYKEVERETDLILTNVKWKIIQIFTAPSWHEISAFWAMHYENRFYFSAHNNFSSEDLQSKLPTKDLFSLLKFVEVLVLFWFKNIWQIWVLIAEDVLKQSLNSRFLKPRTRSEKSKILKNEKSNLFGK